MHGLSDVTLDPNEPTMAPMGQHALATRVRRTAMASQATAAASARWFVGISRHGVVAAERFANQPLHRTGVRYVLSQFAGSILIGLGVSLFVHARLGVPAYDVMLTALRDRLDITLGQASWVLTGFLFLVATALGRRPGIAGLAFLVSNGIAVDVALSLVRDPEPMVLRLLFVVLGTISIAGGVALIVHAGLTGGAMELLMNAAADRGLDPFRTRYALEISIVVGGVLLGGDLGFATVFFVLTMSPMLKIGRQALGDHRAGRANRLRSAAGTPSPHPPLR